MKNNNSSLFQSGKTNANDYQCVFLYLDNSVRRLRLSTGYSQSLVVALVEDTALLFVETSVFFSSNCFKKRRSDGNFFVMEISSSGKKRC